MYIDMKQIINKIINKFSTFLEFFYKNIVKNIKLFIYIQQIINFINNKFFNFRKLFYKSYVKSLFCIVIINLLLVFFFNYNVDFSGFKFRRDYFCGYDFFFFSFLTLLIIFFFVRIDYQDKKITETEYENFFEIVNYIYLSYVFFAAIMICVAIFVRIQYHPDIIYILKQYLTFEQLVTYCEFRIPLKLTTRGYIKYLLHFISLVILYTYFYTIKYLDNYLIKYNFIQKISIYIIVNCLYFFLFQLIHL